MKIVYSRYTAIKYDRCSRRWSLLVASVSTVMFLAVFVLLFTSYADLLEAELIGFFTIGGCVMCPGVAIAGWLSFANSTTYLRRLRAYGYEVPERKAIYRGLEEIPRNTDITLCRTGSSMESIALSVVCWAISVGCLAVSLMFHMNYKMFNVGIVFCGAAAIFWIILGAHYFRQRSREKYRYDVETEPSVENPRKVRTHFTEGLVTIVVMLFVTYMALFLLYVVCGVIFRAKQAGVTDY